ncbi:hypothetical protein [Streptomyces sp. GC420]|uniref:hypothetical protein n=1 Tax=Streptomyces sp. GC420 TaxID=2697568 RepID=UPI001AA1C02B|nr:hypothetical protein [Streptomyces sp. GC420]
MSHAVPALAAGVLSASGCVWYLPAVADVRAGADRPVSRRLAAASCLTGWSTTALLAVLLLLPAPWAVPLTAAAAGAAATLVLRVLAAVRRGRERREDAHCWAALRVPPPGRPAVPVRTVLVTLLAALVAAPVTATATLLTGATPVASAVLAAAVVLLALVASVLHAHAVRRRTG